MEKKCSRCNLTKPFREFHKHAPALDGLKAACKICRKVETKDRYSKIRVADLARRSAYYFEHKAEKQAYDRVYREKNRENRRKYFTNYSRVKRQTDLGFRLQQTLRSRLRLAIKTNQKRGSAVQDLGCSIPELKSYLESKFQPGMTWDNWGRDGWHIDHIKPLASFDLTDPEQFRQACHYTNLQPLWAEENFKKSCKVA